MEYIKRKPTINELNKLLPFKSVVATLGSYFTICSIAFGIVSILKIEKDVKVILYLIEGSVALIAIFLTLFIISIWHHRNFSRRLYKECLNCINAKVNDSFHNMGLVHLDELLKIEESLGYDNDPSSCYILIYTSDLATEKEASKEVNFNRARNVNYRVLYFENSCTPEETMAINELYGSENLINIGRLEKYKESFDCDISKTIGFDLMIYCNSAKELRGFFAVDFVPEKKNNSLKCAECLEKCNLVLESQPFYKEMSLDWTKQLYKEIFDFWGNKDE